MIPVTIRSDATQIAQIINHTLDLGFWHMLHKHAKLLLQLHTCLHFPYCALVADIVSVAMALSDADTGFETASFPA